MDDRIRDFAFVNNTAFAAGFDSFFILEISSITQPSIISSLNLEAPANAICLSNGFVYLSLHGGGILILDISDLYNPAVAAF